MRIALIVHDTHIAQIDERLRRCETRSGFIRDAIEAYCRVRPPMVAAAPVVAKAKDDSRIGICCHCKIGKHAECINVAPAAGKRTIDRSLDVCDCAECAAVEASPR